MRIIVLFFFIVVYTFYTTFINEFYHSNSYLVIFERLKNNTYSNIFRKYDDINEGYHYWVMNEKSYFTIINHYYYDMCMNFVQVVNNVANDDPHESFKLIRITFCEKYK